MVKSAKDKSKKRGKHSQNNSMSSKNRPIKKKKSRHDRKHIKTLFQALRKESLASIMGQTSSEPSILSIDSSVLSNSLNTTVIEFSTHQIPPISSPKKRKANNCNINSSKRQKLEQTLIIIDEDDLGTGQQPQDTYITPSTNKQLDDSVQLVSDDQTNNNKVVQNIHHIPMSLNVGCSTPISKNDKKNLQNLIMSNFPNNNDSQTFNEEVANLTREINQSEYLTIDLTEESILNSDTKKEENTVIDLANATDDKDCTFLSARSIQSMSEDSDVTVVNMSRKKREEKVHKYINRIANLDSSGKVLESVMNKIFNGCKMVRNAAAINNNNKSITTPPKEETAEDVYIKEVILGQTMSRNSIGSNIYNPNRDAKTTGLRMVVVDGSNVAMQHGKGRVFSVKGLKICIDYFVRRGHVVKAFVPRFRCKFGKSSDPRLLDDLERRGFVVYTPSREIQGRLITSYDDRYIVQCAAEFDAVIVSGDNYRDLMRENPRWQFVIENRLLQFTWVNDMIMFPRDPLGRHGPTLENFLRHTPSQNTNKP